MDVFQGQYKLEPRDHRYFSALYLFIRILNVALLCLTNGALYLPVVGAVFMLMTIAVAIARPYKYFLYNTIEIALFSILTVLALAYPIHVYSRELSGGTKAYHLMNSSTSLILSLLVMFYTLGLFLYKTIPKKLLKRIKNKITAFKEQNSTKEEGIPYQLQSEEECTPLLSNN